MKHETQSSPSAPISTTGTGSSAGPGAPWSRRAFLATGTGVVVGAAAAWPFVGCGSDGAPGAASSGGGAAPDLAAKGKPWEDLALVVDLKEQVHLADLDHLGEFIDFGTAGRFKSTLGGWMAGFGNDTQVNGSAFSWATTSPSRIYFSLEAPAPLEIRLRVKRGGTESFSVYVNDKPLSKISLPEGWSEHRVAVAVEHVLAGENQLKLIYQTSERVTNGLPASFAVDYIRIIALAEGLNPDDGFALPNLDGLAQSPEVKGEKREALVVSLPTRLSYYLEVPKANARFCAGLAALAPQAREGQPFEAKFALRVTPAVGGQTTELKARLVKSDAWVDEMVDLSAFAGQLVRLQLIAEGPRGGRLALAEPALRIAPPRITAGSAKPRNVVVLLIDTQRADKLGVYGQQRVRSPALDKFARESAVFERCQATSNWTKPSCASVLTGLYPDTHKARGDLSRLSNAIKLGSELFRDAGFATGAFIANGYLATEFGFNRGWNKYVNFIRENRPTEAPKVYGEALAWITANKDKPFFTYIQTIDPHVPYDPPADELKVYDAAPYEGPVSPRSTGTLLEEFKRGRVQLTDRDRRRLEALYDGEVSYHDRHFGMFLDQLVRLGLLDNTAIIVCADHGEEFFEHQSVGHGHTLHQELLHVPLIVRAPRVVPPSRLPHEVSLVDVLPTALGLTGVAIPEHLEGHDLTAASQGAAPQPFGAAFSSFWSEADERNLSWAAQKGSWKLRMHGPARTFLYRLDADPREQKDVEQEYPVALRAMRILHGQFVGSPLKRDWLGKPVAAAAAAAPAAGAEKTDVPADLREQLRALGYAN